MNTTSQAPNTNPKIEEALTAFRATLSNQALDLHDQLVDRVEQVRAQQLQTSMEQQSGPMLQILLVSPRQRVDQLRRRLRIRTDPKPQSQEPATRSPTIIVIENAQVVEVITPEEE